MKLTVREMAVFSMLGALMLASKIAMEFLPNVHLIGVLTVSYTVVYRKKALYPIYIFVFIIGFINGFGLWWLPYLYLWLILWGAIMLLPSNLPSKFLPFIYMATCSLHGFLFGTLYAPAQALLFGLDFHQMLLWIAAGIPYDVIHGISNLVCGILIMPIIVVLRKAEKFAMKE